MSIRIIDTLEPVSDFPLMDAHSIAVDEKGTRLDVHLEKLKEECAIEVTDEIEEGSKLPITSGAIYEVFRFLEEI
jgi:hypothetical protein